MKIYSSNMWHSKNIGLLLVYIHDSYLQNSRQLFFQRLYVVSWLKMYIPMNFLTLLNNLCLNLWVLSTWKCMKQKSTTPNSPAINWCYWYVLLVFSIPLFPAFDLTVIFDYMCEKWMPLKIIICKTFQILPKKKHNVF